MAALPAPAVGQAFRPGDPQSEQRARERSRPHLEALATRAGVRVDDLEESRLKIDDLAMAHRRVRQHHRGVPVFGGEAIVHLDRDGRLFATTDNLVRGVRVGSAQPALSRRQAIGAAIATTSSQGRLTAEPTADLWILRRDGDDHLVYRVRLERLNGTEDTTIPIVFVDARSGREVWRYDDLQTGSGESLYSGVVSIETLLFGGLYYMEDTGRRLGTFDLRNGTSTIFRFTDSDDVWNANNQKAGVDAHYGAAAFYDYMKNVHGRDGIDGSGGPGGQTSIDGVTKLVTSRVHYSRNYNNAFWTGSEMIYGDGDGTTFSPLVTLDIVGHEMMHGVTERTAGLVYSGESGALNESMSDVFGALTERSKQGETANIWRIGEQTYTPAVPNDALRFLDDPHAADNQGFTSDDDPDHYSERYTGPHDGGGVHINSGIANKAFYLLAKGGASHHGGSMTGIGIDPAAAIWYKALTTYMTSTTGFAGARTATLNAATAIHGSGSMQANAVETAWCLVGAPGLADADGDGRGDACDPTFTSTPCKVSGTGYTTSRTSFNLGVEYFAGALAGTGSATYTDKAAGKTFKSTKITGLACKGKEATIVGTGTVNSTRTVTFRIDVSDLGAGAATDRYAISWSGGDTYSAPARTLSTGNLIVAPK